MDKNTIKTLLNQRLSLYKKDRNDKKVDEIADIIKLEFKKNFTRRIL